MVTGSFPPFFFYPAMSTEEITNIIAIASRYFEHPLQQSCPVGPEAATPGVDQSVDHETHRVRFVPYATHIAATNLMTVMKIRGPARDSVKNIKLRLEDKLIRRFIPQHLSETIIPGKNTRARISRSTKWHTREV